MTSKNEHTGDKLQTKPASDAYRDGFDLIFRKQAACNHDWVYTQDEHFDWYVCSKCGDTRDKEYVP